jgi:type IV secretory pathway ATPase VirB11/archaellum biosynthesis ATPase
VVTTVPKRMKEKEMEMEELRLTDLQVMWESYRATNKLRRIIRRITALRSERGRVRSRL